MLWQTTRFAIDLSEPRLMGIVNVTPDSFSDGGQHARAIDAMRHCDRLIDEGAHILDIGGESSRPGAQALPVQDELDRVLPVLKHALSLGVPVSIDTYKPQVMQTALDLGVDIINDIWALRQDTALEVVASHPSCGVCLMHMRGSPVDMQHAPHYDDVVTEVLRFWQARLQAAAAATIQRERIVLDPGIGFGKRVSDNLALLARQSELMRLGQPLLVGWSRKSTLGALTGQDVEHRLPASIAATLLAAAQGAAVLRVHDVAASRDALRIWSAVGKPQLKDHD